MSGFQQKKLLGTPKGKGKKNPKYTQSEETASIRTRCRYDIDVEFSYRKFIIIMISINILMEKQATFQEKLGNISRDGNFKEEFLKLQK